MSTLINNIKYGFRQLIKSPGFTIVVILIIGLCVGANTAIFNALDQIAIRPLPVKKARELVGIHYLWHTREGQFMTDGIFNYPLYEAYRDQIDVFSGLAAFCCDDVRLRVNQDVKRIQGLAVSSNYFSVLGVTPALGRVFNIEQESDTSVHPVVVISDRFRRQQFGADVDVVGKQIFINDQLLTIVGVTQTGFNGSVVGWVADVYVPLGTYVGMHNDNIFRDNWTWLHFLGRLKHGISREQAEVSLGILNKHLKASGLDNVHENILISDGSRGWIAWNAKGFHRPLSLFMVIAAFVLIIASVNIANMQLSRAATRQKEIAIRQALGAGCWRVIRQLLVESLLLALAGGMCGVVLAVWLDRVLCVLLSRLGSVSMIPGLNLGVLFFAIAVSLLVGLIFGLMPALQMVRGNVISALKESSGVVEFSARRWNPHHLLAVIQITMAVVVLVCGSFFIQSVVVLNRIDPGYDTRKLLAVSLDGSWLLNNRTDLRQFFENLQTRIQGSLGIETTCLANLAPLSEAGSMRTVTHIDGVEISKQRSWWYGIVEPEYFKILNMSLMSGRLFSDQDTLHSPRVMVINDLMAQKYWPNKDPLGRYVTFGGRRGDLTVQIIGVVKSSKMRSITEGERPIAYLPLAQDTRTTPALLIRTAGDPHAMIPMIRSEAASLSINEVCHISTVSDRVAELFFPQHAVTMILNLFGLAGLVLCVTGLYSVITYAVRQRTREIGIRIALGARSRHVVQSILGKGAGLTVVGLGLGLVISIIAIRILESLLISLQGWNKFILYGVNFRDPVIFTAVPIFVLVVTLLACYLPARRAAKVDPMEALRYE